MANLLRRRQPIAVPQAIVAAATQIALDGSSWKNFKFGDQKWQEEAWRHYDICGELRYIANWIGNAVSRCRLYVAEVDDSGRPGEEATDPDIIAIAETMFGGPAGRAEAQRALGIHLTVPGEAYIVAESVEKADTDIWYVASTTEVRRNNDKIVVDRSNIYGGGKRELEEKKDLLIRVWTPHPRRHDLADTAVRAVLPILREIEQLTKHVFAQIDSRLAGAGLLLLPNEIEFPRDENDPNDLQGFMQVLARNMGAALSSREDPSSLVPVMAKVPGEYVDKIKHLTFETPLTEAAKELRQEAIRRLALALDVPPEILLGQGSANHWSAWQIEEAAVKVHVVPVVSRIADALTSAYLTPALKILGEDPERFTFWFDTSPLTQRPDRQAEAKDAHALGLISDKAMRQAGNWSEEDAPDDDERQRRLVIELIKLNPAFAADPKMKEIAGLPPEVLEAPEALPQVAGEDPLVRPPTSAVGPAPAPPDQGRGLPARPQDTGTPAQAALEVGSDIVVRRAMELAGKRLLTRTARVEPKCQATPAHLLHTHLKVLNDAHATNLLAGAFDYVPAIAERAGANPSRLTTLLDIYCRELLLRGVAHDAEALRMWLSMGMGLPDGP